MQGEDLNTVGKAFLVVYITHKTIYLSLCSKIALQIAHSRMVNVIVIVTFQYIGISVPHVDLKNINWCTLSS